MKLKKSLAVVLTSAALFSVCTGTMVEASKRGENPNAHQSGSRKPKANQSDEQQIIVQSDEQQRIVLSDEQQRIFEEEHLLILRIVEKEVPLIQRYNDLKKRREEILKIEVTEKKTNEYVKYLVERRRFQADLIQLEIDKTMLGISKHTDEDLPSLKDQARRVRREAKYIKWLSEQPRRDWGKFSRIIDSPWHRLQAPFIEDYETWQKFLPAKIKKISETHPPCLSWVTDDHKWNNFEQNQRRITFNADFTQNNPERVRVLQMDTGNHAIQTNQGANRKQDLKQKEKELFEYHNDLIEKKKEIDKALWTTKISKILQYLAKKQNFISLIIVLEADKTQLEIDTHSYNKLEQKQEFELKKENLIKEARIKEREAFYINWIAKHYPVQSKLDRKIKSCWQKTRNVPDIETIEQLKEFENTEMELLMKNVNAPLSWVADDTLWNYFIKNTPGVKFKSKLPEINPQRIPVFQMNNEQDLFGCPFICSLL